MYESYFNALNGADNVRGALSSLREKLSAERKDGRRVTLTEQQKDVLCRLLKSDDPKIRKNTAMLMGEQHLQDRIGDLRNAYVQEETLYVRSSYLKAMKKMDYSSCRDVLEDRLAEISHLNPPEEDKKHIREELLLLRDMTGTEGKLHRHVFTGYGVPSDMILVTDSGFEGLLQSALPSFIREDSRIMRGGVEVVTDKLNVILGIRTYREILFRFMPASFRGGDVKAASEALARSSLVHFLKVRHRGDGPFRFRIDMRTKLHLTEKAKYIRRLSAALEEKTGGALVNSISHYEVEIRLIEQKNNRYTAYLRLPTIPEERFLYRKHMLATSMTPVHAAQICALVRDYLKDGADVLDPFCGNATLLIERQKIARASHLYGVDIFGEAIDAAKENAALAGVPMYLINKDCLQFTHTYPFQEILTEVPGITKKMDREKLSALYRGFCSCLPKWTDSGATAIIITGEPELFRQTAECSGQLKLKAKAVLPEKMGRTVLIYRTGL